MYRLFALVPLVFAVPSLSKAGQQHNILQPLQSEVYERPLPYRVEARGHSFFIDRAQENAKFFVDQYPKWEPHTFKAFEHFIKPDSVVLDVGAWIGPTVLYSAQLAGTVVALEPTKKAFAELTANLHANDEAMQRRVVPLNVALGAQDMQTEMTNKGNSMDRLPAASFLGSNQTSFELSEEAHLLRSWAGIDVHVATIDTLRKQHPLLEKTSFVKIDTEGYEHVIIPALKDFFEEKKPSVFLSLHPMFISHEKVQGVVDKLAEIFPYLYEVDMSTPFKTVRSSYNDGAWASEAHGGADVIATWSPLP